MIQNSISLCVMLVTMVVALRIQKEPASSAKFQNEVELYNEMSDSFEIMLDENEMASQHFKTVGI